MGMNYSAYVAYGVLVANNIYEDLDDEKRYKLQETLCLGPVLFMTAGAFDAHKGFIVISDTWKEVEEGFVMLLNPYEDKAVYHERDTLLTSTAEEHNLKTLSPPSWIVVGDVS